MDDQSIVALYWARDEQAIGETAAKYGSYCLSIAKNILKSDADSEECVNDTWLHTWNSVPPKRPSILSAYLGTITRNLSLSRFRDSETLKRKGNKLSQAYDELEESLPGSQSVEEEISAKELGHLLDQFLRTLSDRDCYLFIRRYWYLDSMAQIAHRYGMPEGSVKSRLHAIRKKLKTYLKKEGYGQ